MGQVLLVEDSKIYGRLVKKKIEATPVAKTKTDKDVHVTVSIGLCTDFQLSLEEMIKVVDENLYRAKEEGRNRIQWGWRNCSPS